MATILACITMTHVRLIHDISKYEWGRKKERKNHIRLFPVFSSFSVHSHTNGSYSHAHPLQYFLSISCISFRLVFVERKHPSNLFLSLICLLACSLALTNALQDSEQKHHNILCVFCLFAQFCATTGVRQQRVLRSFLLP